jgi:multidrug efflux pump subunit AcrA (membrane-fusion protein)
MSTSAWTIGRAGRQAALGAACALLWLASGAAHAHGGQIEVAGGGPKGPVQLSAAQQKAIGLRVATAAERALATELNVNGDIRLDPNRQADVSLRISGQVTAVKAQLGDAVRKGQALAMVQSRLVGDPPPSVAITAPMAGVVDARNVILGQAVEPNTVLFHISDRAQLLFAGRVYEADLGKVRLGQEVRVRALSYPDQVFQGKVTLIDPNLDAASRTVLVWARLPNPKGLLKPNMDARASIVVGRADATLTVPSAAILQANGEHFVFVRDGSKFSRVDVAVGARDDRNTEVTDGLVPGDEVVTQGARQVYTQWLTGGQLPAGDD